jgi:hypothetical protein
MKRRSIFAILAGFCFFVSTLAIAEEKIILPPDLSSEFAALENSLELKQACRVTKEGGLLTLLARGQPNAEGVSNVLIVYLLQDASSTKAILVEASRETKKPSYLSWVSYYRHGATWESVDNTSLINRRLRNEKVSPAEIAQSTQKFKDAVRMSSTFSPDAVHECIQ